MKKIRKTVGIALAVCMLISCLPFTASANVLLKGSCGTNVKYTLDGNGTLAINGSGATDDFNVLTETNRTTAPWGSHSSMIKRVYIRSGVTAIGTNAFYRCENLSQVVFESNVENIKKAAFRYCTSLNTISIPASVTSIADSVFAGCPYLNTISVDPANTVYESKGNCIIEKSTKKLIAGCPGSVIPADGSVTSIGMYAFRDLDTLYELELPETLTAISGYAIGNCANLGSITVPSGVASIPAYAFLGNGIFYAEVQSGTTVINSAAFYDCADLEYITLPSTLTAIGQNAFKNVDKLKAVYFRGTQQDWNNINVTASGNEALNSAGVVYNVPADAETKGGYCGSDTNRKNNAYILAPDGTLTVSGSGEMMEFEQTKVDEKYVTLAPWGWQSVKKLVVGNGVTSIGGNAFEGCENLKTAELPATLNTVGYCSFFGTGLETVDFKGNLGQYNSIEMDDGNSALENARKTYSSLEASGFCGSSDDGTNLTWSLDRDGTLTISGSGEMNESFPAVKIDGKYRTKALWGWEYVNKVVVQSGVTSIGASAFRGCESLTSAVLPASLEQVGIAAFYESGLNSVTYNGTPAKYNSMHIGTNNGELIESDKTMTSYTLSGYCGADEDGRNLTYSLDGSGTLTISGTGMMKDYSLKTYYYKSFDGILPEVPLKLTVEKTDAPWGWDFVKKVVINSGVTSVGSFAFAGCHNLSSVSLPGSLESIGASAFACCTGLKTVTFPVSLTTIQDKAFFLCKELTDVTLNKNLAVLGEMPFMYCFKLAQINVDSENSAFSSENGVLFNKRKNRLLIYPDGKTDAEYFIPDSVNVIASFAFCEPLRLETLNIPESVIQIREEALIWGFNAKTVAYLGSQSDFNDVDVETYNYGLDAPNMLIYRKHAGDHVWDYGTVKTPAGCTTSGVMLYACTVTNCIATKEVEIPATNHSWGAWTKLNDAQHRRICSNDTGHVETADHTWNAGVVTQAATCTEDGVKTYTCTACGATKTETLDQTGHSWGAWKKYNDEKHRRSCLNNGRHVEIADHTWDSGTVTKPATTSAEGERVYTCPLCGATRSETIPIIPATHTHSYFIKYNETDHWYECLCGSTKDSSPHTWDDGAVTVSPMCIVSGVKTYTCTVCNAEKTETISPTGHNFGAWTKLNDAQHQRVCESDGTYTERENHTWDAGKVTKAATCTADGIRTYTCSVCKGTKTETISRTGHSFGAWTRLNDAQHQRVCSNDNNHVEKADHIWDSGTVTKAATCTDAGEMTYTCTVCGSTKTATVNATGHSWGAWTKVSDDQHQRVCENNKSHTERADHKWNSGVVTKAATCTENGEKTYTCSVCGGTKTEMINAPGHSWGAWTKLNDTQHQRVCATDKKHTETADHTWDSGKVTKAATCKETGVKTYTCTVCKATKTETIAKTTDHKWDSGKVTKAATCKETGVKTYTCTVCKATKTETIAKTTEHKWDSGKVTKAATCKETGVKTYTCSVCKATKTESIAKTADHTWDSGKVTKEATAAAEGEKTYTCSVCGETKTEAIPKAAEEQTVTGDVDGDGQVLAGDARFALRAAVGLDDTKEGLDFSDEKGRCFKSADVTGDGVILAEDARLILRAAVGLCDLKDKSTW